jgi:hypothetical protein
MNLNLKEKTSNISNTLMEDYWNLDMELGVLFLKSKRKYMGQLKKTFSLEKTWWEKGSQYVIIDVGS